MKSLDGCPQCGAAVKGRCRCMLGDSVCENGHHWHYCEEHTDTIVFTERNTHAPGKPLCTCSWGETYRLVWQKAKK